MVSLGNGLEPPIRLSPNFAAGNNTLSATYIPAVNFYLGSNTTRLFDSRGFVRLFIEPALDLQGQPSLNDRVERGNDVEIKVTLVDNTGEQVSGQLVTISLNGTDITTVITTRKWTAFGVLTTLKICLSVLRMLIYSQELRYYRSSWLRPIPRLWCCQTNITIDEYLRA